MVMTITNNTYSITASKGITTKFTSERAARSKVYRLPDLLRTPIVVWLATLAAEPYSGYKPLFVGIRRLFGDGIPLYCGPVTHPVHSFLYILERSICGRRKHRPSAIIGGRQVDAIIGGREVDGGRHVDDGIIGGRHVDGASGEIAEEESKSGLKCRVYNMFWKI